MHQQRDTRINSDVFINLCLTSKHLNANLLTEIVNQAFIKANIIKITAGIRQRFILNE